MRTAIIGTLIALSMAALSGCGGNGGDSNGNRSFTAQIFEDRVENKVTNVQEDDTVQWINFTNEPSQVVSGTLVAQGNPNVIRLITIGNTGFSPEDTFANLGDTIRFQNLSFNTFQLDIVNDANQVLDTLTIPVGDQPSYTFPSAGRYTVRSRGNSLFAGTVTLFGRPNPDGRFQSPVLNNGDVFTRQFTQTGAFPYFIRNPNDPNRSFITGTVSVQ